jgi:hypothetical protein
MNTVFRYVLLTASRDWLLIGLFAMTAACYGLAVFTGTTALAERLQASVVIFAGAARMALALGMIVFVCFHIRRSFENREVEAFLSKPVSRPGYVVGCWLGYAALSVPPILFVGIMLAVGRADMQGTLLWCLSVFCEQAMLAGFAVLTALIMGGAVASVFSSVAFYITARLLGYFVAVMQEQGAANAGGIDGMLETALLCVSMLLPRLDLFGRSSWLVYGVQEAQHWYFFVIQSAVYVPLLLFMAQFDIKRKQF